MLTIIPALCLALPVVAGTAQEAQAVITANNQFALDLYGQLRGGDGNRFFSPYSINKTLAMAYAGARGATAREMAAVMHFNLGQERQHHAFLEARNLINRNLGATSGPAGPFQKKRGVQLNLSASLWGQRGYGFEKDFLNLLQECYGAGLQEIDFTASERARQTINAWVEKQTHDKIRGLFQDGTLPPTTRLVLASAIYFKGDWLQPFKKNRTSDEAFRTNGQDTVKVPMMRQTERFGYFEDEQMQALRLPYDGGSLALIVLLPKRVDGLANLEKGLSAAKLASWFGQVREHKVEVLLPRFKLTGEFSLGDALAAMGMKKALTSGAGDFSGMNAGRESLYISNVSHKAFVEVNEEGTEVAAATGVAVGTLSAPGLSVPVFRADHPFVFAICDTRTGLILFLGRVARP